MTCENLVTVTQNRVTRTIGSLPSDVMLQIDDCLKSVLGKFHSAKLAEQLTAAGIPVALFWKSSSQLRTMASWIVFDSRYCSGVLPQ